MTHLPPQKWIDFCEAEITFLLVEGKSDYYELLSNQVLAQSIFRCPFIALI